MIEEVDIQNDRNSTGGYYAIIPATVLYNNDLKPNEKLLYAVISNLAREQGYCYATNKYLAEKFGVNQKTITVWISDLRKYEYIIENVERNEKKEVVARKLYVNDTPYKLKNGYSSPSKNGEPPPQNTEDNNINNNNINTYTIEKQTFMKNVYLYDYEYTELINSYGEKKANRCIEELSLYKQQKGEKYDSESDYASIKRWVIHKIEELDRRYKKINNTKSNYKFNYEQRDYSNFDWDSLYANNPENMKKLLDENNDEV